MSHSAMCPCQIAAAAIDSFVALREEGRSVQEAHELAITAAADLAELAEFRADAAAEEASAWEDSCPF